MGARAPITDAPISRRATALPPAERRAAIVAATLPLMMQHGTRVSTRQIAQAAGIAEGTIFRVFPDKEALVAAVVDSAFDPAPVERALAAIDASLPFDERLTLAVVIMQRRLRDIWNITAAVGVPNSPPSPRHRTSEFKALTALFDSERDQLVTPAEDGRADAARPDPGADPSRVGARSTGDAGRDRVAAARRRPTSHPLET